MLRIFVIVQDCMLGVYVLSKVDFLSTQQLKVFGLFRSNVRYFQFHEILDLGEQLIVELRWLYVQMPCIDEIFNVGVLKGANQQKPNKQIVKMDLVRGIALLMSTAEYSKLRSCFFTVQLGYLQFCVAFLL